MKILVLAGRGNSSRAVVNRISQIYDDVTLVVEQDVKRSVFLKNRIKRLGVAKTAGQIVFMALVPGYLRRRSRIRIGQIASEYRLDFGSRFYSRVHFFETESVNSDETIAIIQDAAPDIIVVNGTRIIARRVLECTRAPFLNMHMGITPLYRGVHGGYWAAAQNDREHFGVTIHLVSEGIDTGDVICQKIIQTMPQDNFVTYPYLQMGEGIQLEIQVLKEYEKTGHIQTHAVNLPSKLWSHPAIWEYLKNKKYSS